MQIARLLHLRVCSTAAPLLASLSAFDVNKQAVISQRLDGRKTLAAWRPTSPDVLMISSEPPSG